MAYDMDKMEKVKKWFYNYFIKKDWEEIKYDAYNLYEEHHF